MDARDLSMLAYLTQALVGDPARFARLFTIVEQEISGSEAKAFRRSLEILQSLFKKHFGNAPANLTDEDVEIRLRNVVKDLSDEPGPARAALLSLERAIDARFSTRAA